MSLTTGLVSYWKFDEGAGTTAFDSVGSNDGSILNGTWNTGKINSGLSFNGSSTRVNLSSINSGLNEMSIGLWIKTSGTNDFSGLIIPTSSINNSSQSLRFDTGGRIRSSVRDGGGLTVNAISTSTVDDNNWHYILTTISTSTLKLFIDGVEEVSLSKGNFTFANYNYIFGNDTLLSGRFYNGLLDEIGIWNRALTQAEITELYNGGSGLQYPFASPQKKGNIFMFTA